MALERDLLGDVTVAHGRQESRQRLGADEVRRNELMRATDLHALGNEVKQCRGIDHVTSHPDSVGLAAHGVAALQRRRRGTVAAQCSSGRG